MIVIYGQSGCKYCDLAVELCERYELKYMYKSIDPEYYNNHSEFRTNFPNAKTVPQILWHNRAIGGYTELLQEIENTIGNYGQGAF